MLYQNAGSLESLLFTLPILFVIAFVMLKVGLVVAKTEVRAGFKWVIASYGIQVGLTFFISLPLFFIGISGGFGDAGPDMPLIILTIFMSCFIGVNILNVLHRLGMKRALLIFVLIFIPLVLSVALIFNVIGSNMIN